MNRSPRLPHFCASVILFLASSFAAGTTDHLAEDSQGLIIWHFLMTGCGLAVWAFFPNQKSSQQSVVLVLSLAIVSRLLMAGFPSTDDVNRYLWEGKLLLAGESPYANTAEADAWKAYRDNYWEGMNHRDKQTAYPPLALMLFAGLNLVAYHPWVYKLFFGFMDLAVLSVIIRMLAARRLPIRTSLVYALNPVPILAFAGEAHFDSLFLFLTLAALHQWSQGRVSYSWILIGFSIQIKIVSVLLIPLLFWNHRSSKVLWLLIPLILPSMLFWRDLPALAEGILQFGGNMSHNGSINHVLLDIVGDRGVASKISLALLLGVVAVTSLKSIDMLKGAYILFGALILLSPTVHYWYLAWVLPFVVFFPSLSWLALFGLSAFYFSAWVQFGHTGAWYQPIEYLRLQWIPFYLLWIPLFFRGLGKLLRRERHPEAETLSVVIPVLNEDAQLPGCLRSLQESTTPIQEIIIVDGGSNAGLPTVSRSLGARVIVSKKGRGHQIAAGVKECTSDTVLVLHADARVAPDTMKDLLEAMNNHPTAVGGAIGQRFLAFRPKPVLVFIEALNDFRAHWLGNSFGDQGQFFRRSSINSTGGFPDIPLMEDVELAARLNRVGDLILLDCDLRCSARRWEKESAHKRIVQVLSLVLRYRILRAFGKDPSNKLFEEYYSS